MLYRFQTNPSLLSIFLQAYTKIKSKYCNRIIGITNIYIPLREYSIQLHILHFPANSMFFDL